MQRTLLHEITHACLSHLELPLWVEEGMTQLAEEAAVNRWNRFQLEPQAAAEVRKYWRDRGLADFWWGRGFSGLDDGQSHSYRLADILFRSAIPPG